VSEGGIFIVPHLLWHGTSIFPVSSEGLPHLVASYDTQGDVEEFLYEMVSKNTPENCYMHMSYSKKSKGT
jgi:hypothetical protein